MSQSNGRMNKQGHQPWETWEAFFGGICLIGVLLSMFATNYQWPNWVQVIAWGLTAMGILMIIWLVRARKRLLKKLEEQRSMSRMRE